MVMNIWKYLVCHIELVEIESNETTEISGLPQTHYS